MATLKYVEALGRTVLQDEPAKLAISTWSLLRDAVKSGKTDEALALFDHLHSLDIENSDRAIDFYERLLTQIATLGGEEEAMKAWKTRAIPKIKTWLASSPSVMDALERCAELQRCHHGNISIKEDKDKYVTTCDPCGSGGRLRQTREVGKTKKAYPWTWNKVGVPYYCIHCALQWEIIPIELRGYPIRITLFSDNPADPCVHLFYKKPELVPEEYFARVGKTKTIK